MRVSVWLQFGVIFLSPLGVVWAASELPGSEPVHIAVSILPQKYFVERIGGDRVAVTVMVAPGASPATYEPAPSQLKTLRRAAVYFTMGVPFESAWIERFSGVNPQMTIVDMSEGIERMTMAAHGHGAGAKENEKTLDPHVWLAPSLVATQAATIYRTLARLDPDSEDGYRANLERFLADIEQLDRELRATLGSVASKSFMVFHPAWNYFAREYGLDMLAVEVGGQEPSASELASFIRVARRHKVDALFAQPEFSTRTVETLAREIGCDVVLVSPLAGDWLDNLRRVARAFENAGTSGGGE